MTDPGVSPDDMLSFPWRSRTGIPQVGDGTLDALLARDLGPEETTAALRPVTELLAALRGTPSGGELAGLDRALAEFHRAGSMLDGSRRSHPRRRPLRRTPLSAKLAGAIAAAVLAGGGIAAAYADVLPAALQKFAHTAIAAPAANSSPSPGETRRARVPAGPGPSGTAAHGLCSAYARAEAHGSAARRDVVFRKLVAAAGGADKVAAYCATVRGPSAGPAGHATGRPTARPSRPSRPVKTPPGKHKGKAAAR